MRALKIAVVTLTASILLACLPAIPGLHSGAPDRLPPHTGTMDEAARFLVEHICPGGAPAIEICDGAAPAWAGRVPVRRADWPREMVSNSVMTRHLDQVVVAQTFDFGNNPQEAFGRRDPGDGGDAIRVGQDGVGIYFTQDPGGGAQWLQGPRCPEGAGWLLWRGPLSREWSDSVAQLAITRSATACPSRWSSAYTRWRLTDHEIAWRSQEGGAGDFRRATMLVEHYGGATRETAWHMERFFFGELLGKWRWERWEHIGRSSTPNLQHRAEQTAYRCPGQPEPSPGDGWVRLDCRHWMVFERGEFTTIEWP